LICAHPSTELSGRVVEGPNLEISKYDEALLRTVHPQDYQRFKGAGFNAQLKAITDLYGEAGLKKVIAGSSDEFKEWAKKKVLENEWIPDRVGAEGLSQADRILGKGDLSLVRKLGYLIAKDNLSGIYKVFIRLTTIESLLKRADVVWKKYYSDGFIEILTQEPNHYIFEIVNYQPYPSTCTALLGWLDTFFEVYKLKGTATHIECKNRGGKRCIFELTWK
jgi:hypothetical protein